MDFLNRLNSVKVIDTRVQADLIHDNYSSFLCLGIQLAHGGGNVARSDNMGLSLDSGLDDSGVISVRDERDHQVMFCYGGFECGCVIDIK